MALGSLLAPSGHSFFGDLALLSRICDKAAPGWPKEPLLGASERPRGGFWVTFRRISGPISGHFTVTDSHYFTRIFTPPPV